MSWNLFLALIPFLLAQHLFHPKQKVSLIWSIGLVFFVLFLPNAPYIFTDLIHLYITAQHVTSPMFLAAATLQFLLLELIAFWLFAVSYHRFERYFLNKTYYSARYSLRMVAFVTMSIGVYLGRVARLNSWDVFTSPYTVISKLDNLLAYDAFKYIGIFTICLFLLYKAHESMSINNQ